MNNSSLLTADRMTHLKIVVDGADLRDLGLRRRYRRPHDRWATGAGACEATDPVIKAASR